jgi:hypothetical protein
MKLALALLASLAVTGCQDRDRFDLQCVLKSGVEQPREAADIAPVTTLSVELSKQQWCRKFPGMDHRCYMGVQKVVRSDDETIVLADGGGELQWSETVDRQSGVWTTRSGHKVMSRRKCTKHAFTKLPKPVV